MRNYTIFFSAEVVFQNPITCRKARRLFCLSRAFARCFFGLSVCTSLDYEIHTLRTARAKGTTKHENIFFKIPINCLYASMLSYYMRQFLFSDALILTILTLFRLSLSISPFLGLTHIFSHTKICSMFFPQSDSAFLMHTHYGIIMFT